MFEIYHIKIHNVIKTTVILYYNVESSYTNMINLPVMSFCTLANLYFATVYNDIHKNMR
jgi:hypothetical protein